MQIFGRNTSKWWFVAILPMLILAFPALLMLFFMGNNLAGAGVGPPPLWNRPLNSPPRSDLVGTYQESERNLDRTSGTLPARITLEDDGLMTAFALPSQSELNTCIVSRKGFWGGPYGGTIKIRFPAGVDKSPCDNSSWSLELAGHSKPYSLYMSVGDPDSGTGIWFRQR
jgi:hypothetical protein